MNRVVVFLLFVDKKMTYLRYITKGWGDGFKSKYGKIDIPPKDWMNLTKKRGYN
jgi:hypothetical protein